MTDTHTPYAVFGSPSNTNHGRKCGCQIKFRPAKRTRREDTGYDVYTCAVHGAGPDLLDALRGLRDAISVTIAKHPRSFNQQTQRQFSKACAVIEKAEKG